MKKNIIIAGVPRSGKTTLCHELCKRTGYQHVTMDAIIAGFEEVFPQLGIDSNSDAPAMDNLRGISGKIAPFVNAMMESDEYEKFEFGMAIDIYQLLPQDCAKYINKELCDVYYLGTADATPEERFGILKKYDDEREYTYYVSDEENMRSCVDLVEESKLMKIQCELHNLPYYDTTFDRESVIENLLAKITSV